MAKKKSAERKALRGRITDEATIPNMLMPAYRLESLMHCNNQAQAQETLQDEHVKEWLRVLCAVLFNDDTHMKCYELNMGNVLQDSRTSGDLMLESIPITVERGKLCSQPVVAEIVEQKEHCRPLRIRRDGAPHQHRADLLRLCWWETDLRQLQLLR